MLTRTPAEIAQENGDVYTRYVYGSPDSYAPGVTRSSFWPGWDPTESHIRAGLLTPYGVHSLLLYPFARRNPSPEQRPYAESFREATAIPIDHNDFTFDTNIDYNTPYSGHPSEYLTRVDLASYWEQRITATLRGKPMEVGDDLWNSRPNYGGFVLNPPQARLILALHEDARKVHDRWANERTAILRDGVVPWLDTPYWNSNRKDTIDTDLLRPLLFRTARAGAQALRLDIDDPLHYLEGIDEHLARPLMWYLHLSLEAVLTKSDHYRRHSKKQVEFMAAISELRLPMQHHRIEIANALRVLWDDHNAVNLGHATPHPKELLEESREAIREGFKAMVKWYLTFPSAYEDLVLAHDGPAAMDAVPGGLDFDERLQMARQDLSMSRRARHLLRSAA